MNRFHFFFAVLFLAASAILKAGPAGDVAGHVAAGDADAAGAAVLLSAPGRSHSALTDESGNFLIEALAPGFYSVSASLEGFRKESRAGIEVSAGQTTNLDLSLLPQTFAARIEGNRLLLTSASSVEVDSRPDLLESEALLVDGTVFINALFDIGAQSETRIYRHQGDPSSAELVTSSQGGNRFNSGLTQVDGVPFSYMIDGFRPTVRRLDPLGNPIILSQNADWGGMHAHGPLIGAYNLAGVYRFWELASDGSFQAILDFTTTNGSYFSGIFGAQDTIFARDADGRIFILNVQVFFGFGFSRVVLTCLEGNNIVWQRILYEDLEPIGSVTADIETDILLDSRSVSVFSTSSLNRANRVDIFEKASGARIGDPVILGSANLPNNFIHSKRLLPVGPSSFLAVFARNLGERRPLIGQLIDSSDGSVGGRFTSLLDWETPAFSFAPRPGTAALEAGFPVSHDLYWGVGSLDSTPLFLGPQPLAFAQFGDGAGLTSRIVLTNPDVTQPAQAVIELRSPAGEPLMVDFEDGQITLPGSTFEGRLEVEIPAGGSAAFQTDGMGEVVVGSATVTSPQLLSGVILFGGPNGLAGVGSSQIILGSLSAPVEENASQDIRTGVAVVNLEGQQVTRLVQISDADGTVLASTELSLAPGGQMARFVDELFPSLDLGSFDGTLTLPGEGLVAATVLQMRPGQLATLPVTPFEIP